MKSNRRPTERGVPSSTRRRERQPGGKIMAAGSCALPPDVAEAFWRRVIEYEAAKWTDDFRRLTAAGVELPDPRNLPEEAVHSTLWSAIMALAEMGVFLTNTDHLNDRELYSWLWDVGLRQEVPDVLEDANSAWHVDVLGGCSEADVAAHLKYYADDEWRKNWSEAVPDETIPDHVDPLSNRDVQLPKPRYRCEPDSQRRM